MNRTPAKQRMEAVSALSMANSRYPILMKGKADPQKQLHKMAKATAQAGRAKRLSSPSARGEAAMSRTAGLPQWMRLPAGRLSG